jgi:invasion protein IalB
MRHFLWTVASVAAVAAASPSYGQNRTPRPTLAQASGAGTVLCECRAAGRIFVQGESTCVNGQVAVCAMDQNVTTWRSTGQVCPGS